MLARAVTGALDVNDHGVVKQPIKRGGGDRRIAKNPPPLCKPAVEGQDHGATLVARVDQLEEQIAGTGADAEVADLVDDWQRRAEEKAEPFALGAGQAVDDLGERGEVNAASSRTASTPRAIARRFFPVPDWPMK